MKTEYTVEVKKNVRETKSNIASETKLESILYKTSNITVKTL